MLRESRSRRKDRIIIVPAKLTCLLKVQDLVRAQPLMIWGAEKISIANFFSSRKVFKKKNFLGEAVLDFFSSARPFEIYFFSRKAP